MMKFLKDTFKWGTVGSSLLLALILAGVLSSIVVTDTTIIQVNPNIFKGAIMFVLTFFSSYILLTSERWSESYKSIIDSQRQEIRYLKGLLLEKKSE